ncbi:MAG: hypothetical protein H6732_12800 [Alphaproteobacteria bacterium]|nr:hypothetical protein [Alphaproteobacteria bacterium]
MARWLVNRNETQTTVDSMSALRAMAQAGELGPGDMIQPPGASDWLYVVEVPELKEVLDASGGGIDLDDDLLPRRGIGPWVTAAILVALLVGGGFAIATYGQRLPDPNQRILDQVGFSEVVVTGKGVKLMAEPAAAGPAVAAVTDGSVLELMAKRGDFYKLRDGDKGVEGWLPMDQVLPAYLIGGGDVMREYDPLYNPDRYLLVQNAGWMQLPEQLAESITVFQFMLANDSDYDMTDLVLVAKIKDSRGHELEQVEFRVEGVVPANGQTMVGTLVDPENEERRLVTQVTFDGMAAKDPELRLEYNDGVEVTMTTADFTEASIDIVELRALPKG